MTGTSARCPARRLAPLALVVALAAAALGGCAAVSQLAQGAFKTPTLQFRSASIESIDFDGATVGLDYTLNNPNGFGVTLARVRYGLSLEGREVTRGEVTNGLQIPAAGQAPVRFTARLPFAEVGHLLELVQRHAPVPYTVAGAVGVDTPVGVVELPVQHSGTVDLPGLPAFRFAGADVRMSGLTDLVVDVKIGVKNPNPFPIPAGLLAYALSLSGQPVAQVDGHQLAGVAAHGDGTITIPVRLSILGAGRAAASALQGSGAEVRLNGSAQLGAIPVPLDVGGTARR